MTHAEALALDEDLQQLAALRKNKFWVNHVVPELERLRAEHRSGMRDRTLTPAERCEHVTGFDDAQTLLDFPGKEEERIRAVLREHDRASHTIERPFSSLPPG